MSLQSASAAPNDYISYLSSNAPWKSYVPQNFEIFQKKGEAAFYKSNDDKPEILPESKILMKAPFAIFKPNITVDAERKTNGGETIYKTSYTIDAYSRRLTENQANPAEPRRNAIFLGCSFTFGTGLADDETFPYYFSKYRPNFNVYNFGIDGAGANDILDDLRSFKRFADISKSEGLVVYTAIYDHIERSVCNLKCYGKSYRDWVLGKSNYQYDPESQSMVNTGSFENSRPVTSMIFSVLYKIGLIDSIVIPTKYSDEQLELYVMMVAEMKKIAKTKLNSDFYFIFYPGNYGDDWERIKPLLKKYSVKYLDLSKMDFKTATNGRHSIILDGHPTKLANYLYASLIHYQLPK
jgi:hypothetical protein